ncbi:MAG: hypothetical protein JSR41_08685 [Proteobacteria bacterium]|nr:hypothetical protein [Pseudomonadota bacterium]
MPLLLKTDKARHELRPGHRALSQRERAVLLMADGQHSVTDFGALFGGRDEAGRAVHALVERGYLQTRAPAPPPSPQPLAPMALQGVESAEAAATPSGADTFEGRRSLATTRMFLFDLCERLFARREPERAEALRNALREARDRASMLAVADAMVADIEAHAGTDRADSIRERIARLLPPESALH